HQFGKFLLKGFSVRYKRLRRYLFTRKRGNVFGKISIPFSIRPDKLPLCKAFRRFFVNVPCGSAPPFFRRWFAHVGGSGLLHQAFIAKASFLISIAFFRLRL